jgi:acyl-CoA thioesterase YciA
MEPALSSIETSPDSKGPKGNLSLRAIAMPADTNPAGQIFGGWLMSQMDLAAGTHATYRSDGPCVTVAVDGMVFHAPVYVGDEVSCFTEITRTGRTSMTLLVEAWVRRRRRAGDLVKVTSGVFHFVAVDETGHSRALPEAPSA